MRGGCGADFWNFACWSSIENLVDLRRLIVLDHTDESGWQPQRTSCRISAFLARYAASQSRQDTLQYQATAQVLTVGLPLPEKNTELIRGVCHQEPLLWRIQQANTHCCLELALLSFQLSENDRISAPCIVSQTLEHLASLLAIPSLHVNTNSTVLTHLEMNCLLLSLWSFRGTLRE